MIRTCVALFVLLLGACVPEPQSRTPIKPMNAVQAISRGLWPEKVIVAPTVKQRAKPAPVAVPVRAKKPRKAETKRAKKKAEARKAERAKQKVVAKPKPKTKPAPQRVDTGPKLRWPCWLVKMNAAGKSETELKAMGRQHGITLSKREQRQARTCLES